tara:strand:+ start:310 stop:498 length:189 start_codon:yes stop_codon:yes gene_type:complete
MGQFKQLHLMFEKGASDCAIAYYLYNNTKVGNWFKAKEIARELRNEYEQENNENEPATDEIE